MKKPDTDDAMYLLYEQRLDSVMKILKDKRWERLDGYPMGKLRALLSQVAVSTSKTADKLDPKNTTEDECGALLQKFNVALRSHVAQRKVPSRGTQRASKKPRMLEPRIEASLKRERRTEVKVCVEVLS